mgnify:CR=1 FL=1
MITPLDIENKKLEVLKNLKFSDIGEQYPVFCDKKLEGTIVYNYLNEKGIQALKEVLWLPNFLSPKESKIGRASCRERV